MNETKNRLQTLIVLILFALTSVSTTAAGEVPPELEQDSSPSAGYHLRIVRVSGPGIDPGAAIGANGGGEVPVMQPDDEAWGSAAQLDALARTLGGVRSDPVTGFFVMADDTKRATFERDVIVGESVLSLRFDARPGPVAGAAHELELWLGGPDDRMVPLAEAKLRVKTNRTVAIASPTPVEDDWLVLAVTLVDQQQMAEPLRRNRGLHLPGMDDVTAPKLISRVDPAYPEAARKAKLQGQVILQAIIDEDGVVRAPTVLSMSDGAEELAASAVEAVLQWRYEPADLRGEPVAVWFTIMVQFRLS